MGYGQPQNQIALRPDQPPSEKLVDCARDHGLAGSTAHALELRMNAPGVDRARVALEIDRRRLRREAITMLLVVSRIDDRHVAVHHLERELDEPFLVERLPMCHLLA